MKWKRKDMVSCMKSFRQFFKHYIYENRRLYIALNTIICVILLIFNVYMAKWTYHTKMEYIAQSFMMASSMIFCVLAIVTPIYSFRFLYKKNHNELYFSLPLKRSTLFIDLALSGFIAIALPMVLNTLLSVFAFIGNTNLLFTLLLHLGMQLFFMFVFYSISLAITVRSNHIFDCLAIGAGYLALPLAISSSVHAIVYQMIKKAEILRQIGVEVYEILPELNDSFMKFFTPVFMNAKNFEYLNARIWQSEATFEWGVCLWWILLACITAYVAYVSFMKREVEASQEQTTTLWGYPLLIGLYVFSLLGMSNEWFQYVLVFIGFCLVIFFAERKITLSLKHVFSFICILLLSFGLKAGVNQLDLFQFVDIIPQDGNLTDLSIFYADENNETNLVDDQGNPRYGVDIYFHSKEDMKACLEMLDTMYDEKQIVPSTSSNFRMSLSKDKRYLYRTFQLNDKGEARIKQFMEEHPHVEVQYY